MAITGKNLGLLATKGYTLRLLRYQRSLYSRLDLITAYRFAKVPGKSAMVRFASVAMKAHNITLADAAAILAMVLHIKEPTAYEWLIYQREKGGIKAVTAAA